MLFAWIPLSFLDVSLWWPVLGLLRLDRGCQALHVTSEAMIVQSSAQRPGRLVAWYMLFYAIGSGRVPSLLPPSVHEAAGQACASWAPASACWGPRVGLRVRNVPTSAAPVCGPETT